MSSPSSPNPPFSCIQILYSTQTGRSKACARRTARILREHLLLRQPSSIDNSGFGGSTVSVSIPVHQSIDEYQLYHRLLLSQQQQQPYNNINHDEPLHHSSCSNSNSNDNGYRNIFSNTLFLFFVSTTGEGEHCDTIQQTWKLLLNKSLPTRTFASSLRFGLFCLGDRAYGDLFCAAGRKFAVRLMQLGSALHIPTIGYGDDGDDGGVFTELDTWIQSVLLPHVTGRTLSSLSLSSAKQETAMQQSLSVSLRSQPYQFQVEASWTTPPCRRMDNNQQLQEEEWQQARFASAYRTFFAKAMCPSTAYHYHLVNRNDNSNGEYVCRRQDVAVMEENHNEKIVPSTTMMTFSPSTSCSPPLVGTVISNDRITASDWEQDTRHVRIRLDPSINKMLDNDPIAINSGSISRSAIFPQPLLGDVSLGTTSKPVTSCSLPYRAGDIASVIPRNTDEEVAAFLNVLPSNIQVMADSVLSIQPSVTNACSTINGNGIDSPTNLQNADVGGLSTIAPATAIVPWPERCTLRGWLTYCADIHSLPEREDLLALSIFCSPFHPRGRDQQAKLVSLSEPSESALYVDYIIREKRTWKDVLFDFDSIRYSPEQVEQANDNNQQEHDSSTVTTEQKNRFRPLTFLDLLTLLPPIRPRDFSLASAPSASQFSSSDKDSGTIWDIELCVAVVQGKTRLGRRHYHGLCSHYIGHLTPSHLVQFWIRPGSFGALPLELKPGTTMSIQPFETPILCIGAGTGIAPLRSMLLEREYIRHGYQHRQQHDHHDASPELGSDTTSSQHSHAYDNVLIFGCRKESADFYYQEEWKKMSTLNSLKLLTAFSQDQWHKVYVQQVLRTINNNNDQNGFSLVRHVVEHLGAIYIAGNPKMARAVKDEIKTILTNEVGEQQATRWLKKLQRLGRFSVEAWS